MSKLEVGMFVRLQNDVENIVIINRIANVFKTTILTENNGGICQGEYTKENVIKASYNIIDTLEVGDYVNGEYIIQISKTFGLLFIETTYYDEVSGEEKHKFIRKEDIKSIVTKEQFESMSYRIGE